MRLLFLCVPVLVGCGGAVAAPMSLREVVLYQNGVGYFERTGTVQGQLRLSVRPHELDDVLTTLTVVGEGSEGAAAPSAVLPAQDDADGDAPRVLAVDLGGTRRDMRVAYATQTAAWRASYRLVLPRERGAGEALLQGWAVIDNTTAEDWNAVNVTLATAAPLSFAVDLRTPRIVARPDVTGHQTPPVALGPVFAERSRAAHDARADVDRDGIVDVDDVCPDDPERYNGLEDEDGCPDHGQVVVRDSSLEILDRVYFDAGTATLREEARPVVGAVAATLHGNPQLTRVEVHGHADAREENPWGLSAERAAAVRRALMDAGVAGERLVVVPHGATQPTDGRTTPDALAQNRRVEYQISGVEEPQVPAGARDRRGIDAGALARTMRGSAVATRASSGTRYVLQRRVSVPAGRSAMVAMLNETLAGEDVLLFRPDASVPTSDVHPFRAARLRNGTVDLVPGPIALFARGELLGQGLLDGLRAGESAFVPYAVDDETRVAIETTEEEVPSRLLSLSEGTLRVERTRIRRTAYTIDVIGRAPGRIFIRHDRARQWEPQALPPGTETSADALLAPVPIRSGRESTLVVEEHLSVVAPVPLYGDLDVDLGRYAIDDGLAPDVRARLDGLLDDRRVLADLHTRVTGLHQRLAETGIRTSELRLSVEALSDAGGTVAIRRRLAQTLEQAVTEGESLARELADLRAREVEAREALRTATRAFDVTLAE